MIPENTKKNTYVRSKMLREISLGIIHACNAPKNKAIPKNLFVHFQILYFGIKERVKIIRLNISPSAIFPKFKVQSELEKIKLNESRKDPVY